MSYYQQVRNNNFPPVVKNIIIINVIVWIAQIALDKTYQITDKIALYPVDTPWFEPYQIATHMFAHDPSGPFHLIFNMFTLFIFGRILENIWGGKRFLIFYFLCGIGAAACHLLVQHLRFDPVVFNNLAHALTNNPEMMPETGNLGFLASAVGASGAVMGVMVAFAYLFPNTPLMLMFIPVPVKAKWLILALVLIDLFGGVVRIQGDNIAHFAHLGGAITGFIIVLLWNKTNRKTLY